MKYAKIIFGIGLALIIIPFLGLPSSSSKFFVALLGAWLCAIVLSVKYMRRVTVHASPRHEASIIKTVAPTVSDQPVVSQNPPSSTPNDHSPTV